MLGPALAVIAALALPGCDFGKCFVAGTRIRTPTGDVRIENIVVGDIVLAMDPMGDAPPVPAAVTDVLRTQTTQQVRLRIDGEWTTTTPEHPYWELTAKAWVTAGRLPVGARLLRWDDAGPRVVTLEALERVDAPAAVFNLTVDGLHTYFANGVLVHNKSPWDTGRWHDSGKVDTMEKVACGGAGLDLWVGQPMSCALHTPTAFRYACDADSVSLELYTVGGAVMGRLEVLANGAVVEAHPLTRLAASPQPDGWEKWGVTLARVPTDPEDGASSSWACEASPLQRVTLSSDDEAFCVAWGPDADRVPGAAACTTLTEDPCTGSACP